MKIKRTDDLGQVAALHMVCFPDDSWEEGQEHWIVTHRRVPVGFAAVTVDKKRRAAMLLRAGVVRRMRGRGAQRKLIEVREIWAAARGLERVVTYVHKGNFSSIVNLLKCGYRMVESDDPDGPFIHFEKKLA